MDATILDLRRRMADVLRALDRHETVTILYRGRRRAILIASESERKDRPAVATLPGFGMWREREDLADVPGRIRALRRSRAHAL